MTEESIHWQETGVPIITTQTVHKSTIWDIITNLCMLCRNRLMQTANIERLILLLSEIAGAEHDR